MLKKLSQFNKFDTVGFLKEKDVRVLAHENWFDFEEGKKTKLLGTKYKCVIVVDNTKYAGDDVQPDLNAGEKIDVKTPHPPKNYKKFSKITFVNPTASVYGELRNQLSVKADDVDIQP